MMHYEGYDLTGYQDFWFIKRKQETQGEHLGLKYAKLSVQVRKVTMNRLDDTINDRYMRLFSV